MDTDARTLFPRGMDQPEGGYRFSLDPLLLACFARVKRGVRLVDLGTGCGVAALAALLRHEAAGASGPSTRASGAPGASDAPVPSDTPGVSGTSGVSGPPGASALGLDIDPAMVEAARNNAARLGLDGVFQAQCGDVRDVRELFKPESFGLTLLNPPYRSLDTGRACDTAERTKARFEAQGSLEDFLDGAAWLTANRGAVALVYPAEGLARLLCGLEARRLTPKRLRLVHSRIDEPARLVLAEAVKNGGAGLVAEAPLALYNGQGAATRLRAAALKFCPFLACNG